MKRQFVLSFFGSHGEYLRIDDCNEGGSNIAATCYLGPNTKARFRCTEAGIEIYGAEDKVVASINLGRGDIVIYNGSPLVGTSTQIVEQIISYLPVLFFN